MKASRFAMVSTLSVLVDLCLLTFICFLVGFLYIFVDEVFVVARFHPVKVGGFVHFYYEVVIFLDVFHVFS